MTHHATIFVSAVERNGLRTASCLLITAFLGGCLGGTTRYEELYQEASSSLSELPAILPSDSSSAAQAALTPPEHAAPLFAGQTELQLSGLIEAVQRRNPTLVAMQNAWRAAVSRYPQVTSFEDPVFSYGIAPQSIDSSDVDFSQKFDLSQRLPWPGKLKLRGDIALSEAEAARGDLQAARDKLLQETKEAFFDYYFVIRAIEINEVNKALLEGFRRIAETRYEVGTASKQDALQAEVEHDHLLHRGIILERTRTTSRAKINTLLNRTPHLDLPPPPMKLSLPGERPDIEALYQRAVHRRPELQALAHRLKGRRAARELAHKDYFPDFNVTASYNSLWQEDDLRPLVGVGINVPLFLEKRRTAEREAKAHIERLKAELSSVMSQIAMEVTESFDRLVETEQIVHLYRTEQLPAARENLEAAQSGYASAKNDFLTLLTAEKTLMLMELSYHQALSEYHQRIAELERAVGGKIAAANEKRGGNNE